MRKRRHCVGKVYGDLEIIELKDGGLVVFKCKICGKTKEAMPSNVQVYGNQHKNCNKIK